MNRLVLALVVMACGRSDTAHVAPPAAAPTATATASAAAPDPASAAAPTPASAAAPDPAGAAAPTPASAAAPAAAPASVAAAPEVIQLGTPLLRRPPVPGGRNMYGEPTTPWRVMIGAIAASADGALLVTADRVQFGESRGVVVWDRAAGREIAVLGDREAHAVAITGDGARVAAVDASDRLRVWNRASGAPVRETPLANGLAVGFSPDGARAIAVGRNLTVVLDLATGARREARHSEAAAIGTVAASGDRVAFVSGAAVQVLAITDGGFPSLRVDAVAPVAQISLSPDGRALGVVDASGVHIHDAASGALLQTNKRLRSSTATLAMLSPTRYVIAHPWFKLVDGSRDFRLPWREEKILAVAPFADGRKVAAAGGGGAIGIWDLGTRLEERAPESHTGPVHCLAFPSPGELMSSGPWGDREFAVRTWSIASRASREPVYRGARLFATSRTSPIDLLAATPDAGRALYMTASASIVLDRDGREREIPGSATVGLNASAFSANGRWLALGTSEGAVVRVDVERLPDPAAMLRWKAHDHEVYSLAISDDGRTIVSVAGELRIWRASGATSGPPRLARALTEHKPYSGVVLDGANRLMISADYGRLELWSIAARARVATLQAATPAIIDPVIGALSADHRLLATGHDSGLVQVWDFASGKRLAQLRRHGNAITAIAFSPDGALATADEDGLILLSPPSALGARR